MSRPIAFATVLAASLVLFVAGPVAAAPAPTPPPGSANVQPAGLASDGQGNPAAYHCGAAATVAGGGYGVQPVQVGPSGTSTPGGCGSSADSGGAPGSGAQTAPAGTGSAPKSAGASAGKNAPAIQTSGAGIVPSALTQRGSASFGGPLWIGLLLLLVLLLLLIGFAAGRRRPARASG